MFTTLELIPARKRRWVPGRAFLERLFACLRVEHARSVSVYSQPLLWNTDWHDSETLFTERVATEELLALIEQRRKQEVVAATLDCSRWSAALFEELRDYAERATTEMCAPCGVDITVGLASFPDWRREKTQASSWFTLSLCSGGLPNDPSEFFEVVTRARSVVALKAFLEEASGFPWAIFMSMSW